MKSRLEVFRNYKTHAWLSKTYKKLTKSDINVIELFIEENDALSKGNFELKTNRLFMDQIKPTNANLILEMLSCCNSAI